MKFGHLDKNSFHNGSLQPLANLVAENENVSFIGILLMPNFEMGHCSCPSHCG